MKTANVDVQALLRNPDIYKEMSPTVKSWVDNNKAFGKLRTYFFIKSLYNLASINKLSNETLGKTIGITNIEKSKFDSDCILLGISLECARGTADLNTDALLKAADYSNCLLDPAMLQQDTDAAIAGVPVSMRALLGTRVDPFIRNGELRYVVGGSELFRLQPDELFVDGERNSFGLKGDFSAYYSLMNTPRLITMDKAVEPIVELAGTVVFFNAVKMKHYVLEISQIN